MKSVYTLIIGLFITQLSFSQITIKEVIFPKYIQGAGAGTAAKVPFVCRLTINGLLPNTLYRYYNKFVATTGDPGNGEGTYYLIKSNGTFTRPTFPSLVKNSANAGVLTSDATGSYTGWFITEPGSGAATIYVPGNEIYFRLIMNDGSDAGSQPVNKLTVSTPVKVINFGTTATDGTAIRSTPVTGATAKNFVFLYDVTDTTGGAQPIAGTYIEADEIDNNTANGFAPFYVSNVNTINGAWGTIIPNNLSNGIRRIGQYSVTTGNEVGHKISTNGKWPVAGGGRANTAGTTGGLTNVIALDGAVARLDGANVKSAQTITFTSLTPKTYGEADFDPGATTSAALPVVYESSITTVADTVRTNNQLQVSIKNAGITDIKATQPGDDFYNPAIAAVQSLTVNKAELTVTADDKQIVQNDLIPNLTITYSGFKNGDDINDLTQPATATTVSNSSQAGTFPIVPGNAAAANYNFKYENGLLTIVPGKTPQIVHFAPMAAKTYGDADFNPGAVADSRLKVKYRSSDTSVAVADTANGTLHIKHAGITTITAWQEGDGGWLPSPDTSQQLEVKKADLTITANNQTRKVGQPNPVLTVTYTGFVNGETNSALTTQPVVSTVADSNSTPGDYDITVTDATADNYNIIQVKGTLTVEALTGQQITFDKLPAKKYGDNDFKPNATASSNLAVTYSSSNPAVAIVRNDSVVILTAGTTVITASQAGNGIYGAASASQTFTVQKARLIVQARDIAKNEGQPVPNITISYSGFVKNEDSTILTALPVAATSATVYSVVGTYPITVQGATAVNYSIAQLNGTLTVLPPQGAAQDNMIAYISSPGQLQVNVYTVNGGKGAVQLFDLNGTRLVNVNVSFAKGSNTFRVPVGNVVPGVYNVRVAAGSVLLKGKIIIQ